MVDISCIPTRIFLSEATLALDDPRKRGLSFESDWQGQLGIHMEPVFGSPTDGRTMISKMNVDAKLISSPYFYLSHDEYCYGRKNGMIYAGYEQEYDVAMLTLACTWEDLREAGYFERFEKGRPSNGEVPWSVKIELAMKCNLIPSQG